MALMEQMFSKAKTSQAASNLEAAAMREVNSGGSPPRSKRRELDSRKGGSPKRSKLDTDTAGPSAVLDSTFGDNTISGLKVVRIDRDAGDYTIDSDGIETCVALLESRGQQIHYDADHNLQVDGFVTLATAGPNQRHAQLESHWLRWGPICPQPWNITWDRSYVKDSLNMASVSDLLTANEPNVRKVADILPGESHMQKATAIDLAPRLLSNLNKYDNSSFYAVGMHIALGRLSHAEAGLLPVWAPLHAGTFMYRNITIAGQALMTDLYADLDAAKFVWVWPGLTHMHLFVLEQIASGLPRFLPVPHAPAVPLFICIHTPNIPMVYYSDLNVVPQALPADATASDIFGCLLDFARMRFEEPDLIRGICKAATSFNGTAEMLGGVLQWYNSQLEFGGAYWPLPRDSNWMWRQLKIIFPSLEMPVYSREMSVVSSRGIEQMDTSLGIMAFVYNVGMGTTFNYFNLTGADLNQWAMGQQFSTGLASFGKSLFSLPRDDGVVMIHKAVSATVFKLFGVRLDPTSWRGVEWSAGATLIINLPGLTGWNGVWQATVPYQASILSLTWALKAWADVWGWFAPPIELEVSADYCQVGGVHAGLWSDQGSQEYSSAAASGAAYCYVSYGILVINALLQQTDALVAPLLHLRPWARSTKVKTSGGPLIIAPPMVMIAGINTLEPGHLLTYSWQTGDVLAPVWLWGNMGIPIQSQMLVGSKRLLPCAGLYLDVQSRQDVTLTMPSDFGWWKGQESVDRVRTNRGRLGLAGSTKDPNAGGTR